MKNKTVKTIMISSLFVSGAAMASDPCIEKAKEKSAETALNLVSSKYGSFAGVTGLGVGACKDYFFQDKLGLPMPDLVRGQTCGVKFYVSSKEAMKPIGQFLQQKTKGSFKIKGVSLCAEVSGTIKPE